MPAEAIGAAKTYLLDSLGVGVAGTRASYVDEWINGYQGAMPGPGGRIWGPGGSLPPPAAWGGDPRAVTVKTPRVQPSKILPDNRERSVRIEAIVR
jgi:hypothetical protein